MLIYNTIPWSITVHDPVIIPWDYVPDNTVLARAVGETPITFASRPYTFQRTTNSEQSADPIILLSIDVLMQVT